MTLGSEAGRGSETRPSAQPALQPQAGEVIIHDAVRRRWLRFRNPVEICLARSAGEVLPALQHLEGRVERESLFAAGFISYEAAPAFDYALHARQCGELPMVWFGLYAGPEVIDELPDPGIPCCYLHECAPTVESDDYVRAIEEIKRHIAAGNTYQVNYTLRLRARFEGDPWDALLRLAHAQQADYCAFVDTGDHAVCSSSPELFFALDDARIVSRPMKGTAPRCSDHEQDATIARRLLLSDKNRAENLMIVDMVRNDMGRIARIGSVKVPRLFQLERYPTVWQMTSTVAADTDASISDILTALFPCASVTGAPKSSTTRIIASLETTPRGVYTGSIGFISPHRRMQFNVAIRTLVISRRSGQAEYGTGGGIVWESEAQDELREGMAKAKVLQSLRPDFQLLETLLWEPDAGFFLLEGHLRRLRASAAHFGYAVDEAAVRKELQCCVKGLPLLAHRLRLLVSRDGSLSCTAVQSGAESSDSMLRLRKARHPVCSANPFLRHKTTLREVYDQAMRAAGECDDVILWNERGEVTESSIANIVLRLGGQLVTPPVGCGLLAGVFREHLLENREIREQIVSIDDIRRCDEIFLVNSVRKWRKSVLVAD